MTVRRYSVKEALNRLLNLLSGVWMSDDTPDTVSGYIYSEDEVASRLAEMVQDSLSGYALAVPFGNHPALPTGTPVTLGGWLYAQNGALYWYGSSGTITALAGS